METKDTCEKCNQIMLFDGVLRDGVCPTCLKKEADRDRRSRIAWREQMLYEHVFDLTTDDTIPIL